MVVVLLGAVLTSYPIITAYMVNPDGSWDHQAITNSKVAAGVGLLFSAFMALVTWTTAKARWLRKWWHVIPTALAIAALLRLTLLAPEL